MTAAATRAWRPRNETDQDLARERAAADAIVEAFAQRGRAGLKALKLGETLYQIDWAFFDHGQQGRPLVSWGEFRWRDRRYDTYVMKYSKLVAGRKWMRATGKPFLMYVEWPDGIWYWRVPEVVDLQVYLFESTRQQNGDNEPVVHVPVNWFVQLTTQRCLDGA